MIYFNQGIVYTNYLKMVLSKRKYSKQHYQFLKIDRKIKFI